MNSLLNRIKKFLNIQRALRKIKIRTRLIMTFLTLSLVPILIVAVLSFINTYMDMEAKAREYSHNISTQIVNNISYRFDNYIDKFERIALNSSILADIYNYKGLKDYRQIEISNRIKYTLASIVGNDEGIDSIEIRSRDGDRFYYTFPITKGSVFESNLITEAYDSPKIIWKVSKKEIDDDEEIYIILAKKMKIQFEKDVTGFTLMAIKRDYLDQICEQITKGKNMYVVITDQDGRIISHPNVNKVLQTFDKKILDRINYNEDIKKSGHDSESIFKISTDEGVMLVAYDVLPKNNWRVISVVPYSFLLQSTVNNGIMTLFIVIVCFLFAFFISLIVTKSISLPIKNLTLTMEKVGKGDLTAIVQAEWGEIHDEHAMLSAGFNDMIYKLRKLIDDVYHSQLKEKELEFLKKEAELNALQQQINPHFLYNTLESIFWMAQLKGENEISEMITALGKFFRTSINKGLEYMTIEDEINNVKNYIYLQKLRFSDRLAVEWEIDEGILKYKTIKLILQPIIENAILHGIESMEKDGMITIEAFKLGNTIVFQVSDNGAGMSVEELEKLKINYFNNFDRSLSKSVGVKNVDQRIKLYFGNEYGVNISSQLGKGTSVVISIPVIVDENDINNHRNTNIGGND